MSNYFNKIQETYTIITQKMRKSKYLINVDSPN